jgi:hypothetical protein
MSSAATVPAFAIHIVGGTVGLIAGVVAVAARKGGPLHPWAAATVAAFGVNSGALSVQRQFAFLGLLVFRTVRVRLIGWYHPGPQLESA